MFDLTLKVFLPLTIILGLLLYAEHQRAANLTRELKAKEAAITLITNVNNENLKTIGTLDNERQKLNSLCSERIKTKDNVINKLHEIENLSVKPIQEGGNTDVKISNQRNVDNGTDPVLDRLNSMFKTTDN